jgi:hypothetical protein
MDKLAALQTFLNGFLPAYEENSIYSLKIRLHSPISRMKE